MSSNRTDNTCYQRLYEKGSSWSLEVGLERKREFNEQSVGDRHFKERPRKRLDLKMLVAKLALVVLRRFRWDSIAKNCTSKTICKPFKKNTGLLGQLTDKSHLAKSDGSVEFGQ
jgi:hypothetical protein